MKILKRYYIFIFIFALVIGLIIRDISTSKFAVIKTSQAYAPNEVKVIEGEDADADGEKVNINTASKRVLMTLDGIGEKMSERIIEYREKNGKFETIEDIMKISGIGYDTFLKLKDYITVE